MTRLFLLLALLFAVPAAAHAQETATVTLVPGAGGVCAARWNGEAISNALLPDRAVKTLMDAIDRAGGVQNITEENLPIVRVEAPADMRYACAGPGLFALRRAGFPAIRLLPLGESRPPAVADFPWVDTGTDTASWIVAMGRGGRLTWNGAPTDLAGLAVRARAAAGTTVDRAPGHLALVTDPEATFGAIYEVVRTLRDAGLAPTLSEDADPPPPVAGQ